MTENFDHYQLLLVTMGDSSLSSEHTSMCVCAATLDGLLLRVLPAVLYSIPFYPMIGFQPGASHVALFFCVLAVFSATVGALSMAITVGFGTAGKAALIMNLVSALLAYSSLCGPPSVGLQLPFSS